MLSVYDFTNGQIELYTADIFENGQKVKKEIKYLFRYEKSFHYTEKD